MPTANNEISRSLDSAVPYASQTEHCFVVFLWWSDPTNNRKSWGSCCKSKQEQTRKIRLCRITILNPHDNALQVI